ncbi:hypothetical protein GH742_01200 [Legionella sp. MW5194]|uniref:hypothetical protein n=1 Tax=Legionella sp. MW5194 TaxID=2662448 RepID=UPI00193E1AE2|nr:hypothetical protein [Legionella sp. MW5194]QRN02600.1 hypothetical protein GH742_01200 [Legionella sp. MW5194]
MTFFDDLKKLPYRDRSNVYALLISKLTAYAAESVPIEDKIVCNGMIKEIKELFFNHEQEWGVLGFILKQYLAKHARNLSVTLFGFLNEVLAQLDSNEFKNYFNHKEITAEALDCRLQRLFESHLAINLLEKPNQKIWASVNKVSQFIVSLLIKYNNEEEYALFLDDLGPDPKDSEIPNLALAFARFKMRPSLDEVIKVLLRQEDLAQVLLIQFMFMRDAFGNFKLKTYPESRATYGGDFKHYLNNASKKQDLRSFFWNYAKVAPHLYTDRGRAEFNQIPSTSMGLCINAEDRKLFPVREASWMPDCICQAPDLNSDYVKLLAEQGIPYVAGPSGMTSLLCGAMIFMGDLAETSQRHYYLLAIVAFIAGGGLHSIHEILTIPHVRLGLLPQYRAFGSKAGNYSSFFKLFADDDCVQECINNAWKSTMDWLKTNNPDIAFISNSKQEMEEDAPAAKVNRCILL